MNIQDLKNNRERIIKAIKKQTSATEAVSGVMTKMVAYLNRSDIQEMKATAANVDKLAKMVILSWIKNDYKVVMTKNEYQEFDEKRKMDNLQSSLRND